MIPTILMVLELFGLLLTTVLVLLFPRINRRISSAEKEIASAGRCLDGEKDFYQETCRTGNMKEDKVTIKKGS